MKNWSKGIRRFHRWTSMAFTLMVIANFAVLGREKIAFWVGTLTLVPLALLLLTGLYLFVLPYLNKGRSAVAEAGAQPDVAGERS